MNVFLIVLGVLLCVVVFMYIKQRYAYKKMVNNTCRISSKPLIATGVDAENEELKQIMYDAYVVLEKKQLYINQLITIEWLARQLDVNKQSLSNAINRIYGTNFKAFINKYRVKKVIKQFADINSNNKTIIEISEECGFNDRVSFYRAFKKETGLSPITYRKQLICAKSEGINNIQ